MKKILNLIIIAVLFLAAFFCFKNIFLTEEGKIKRIVSSGEKAIERKDIIRCASFLSPDYLDSFGNDRRNTLFLTKKLFEEYQDIFIHIESLSIEVYPVRSKASRTTVLSQAGISNGVAKVKFIARVMVSRPGEAEKKLSIEKGSERFLVTFRKEKGEWKLFRAKIPEYRFD